MTSPDDYSSLMISPGMIWHKSHTLKILAFQVRSATVFLHLARKKDYNNNDGFQYNSSHRYTQEKKL